MTAKPGPRTRPPDGEPAPEATKQELQRRLEEARESISQTVGDIRDTVEDQYASVKATVKGLHRDPILWSVGALSAGFALGYTLGIAQKKRSRSGGKASALATFADSAIEELRRVAGQLPLALLDPHVRALFGFDASELLAEIGGPKRPRRAVATKKKHPLRRKKRPARRTSGGRRR